MRMCMQRHADTCAPAASRVHNAWNSAVMFHHHFNSEQDGRASWSRHAPLTAQMSIITTTWTIQYVRTRGKHAGKCSTNLASHTLECSCNAVSQAACSTHKFIDVLCTCARSSHTAVQSVLHNCWSHHTHASIGAADTSLYPHSCNRTYTARTPAAFPPRSQLVSWALWPTIMFISAGNRRQGMAVVHSVAQWSVR